MRAFPVAARAALPTDRRSGAPLWVWRSAPRRWRAFRLRLEAESSTTSLACRRLARATSPSAELPASVPQGPGLAARSPRAPVRRDPKATTAGRPPRAAPRRKETTPVRDRSHPSAARSQREGPRAPPVPVQPTPSPRAARVGSNRARLPPAPAEALLSLVQVPPGTAGRCSASLALRTTSPPSAEATTPGVAGLARAPVGRSAGAPSAPAAAPPAPSRAQGPLRSRHPLPGPREGSASASFQDGAVRRSL